MQLTPAMETFIRHWGEMGARWGVNRSVAQIHALLYLSEKPLPADDIVEILGIARSNVSTSLKELMSFNLVIRLHVTGDRRDHFHAKEDPWDMLRAIAEERKRREVDPALLMVRTCVDAAKADGQTPKHARERLMRMLDLLEQLDSFYTRMKNVPQPVLKRMVKMSDKIVRMMDR